MASGTRERGLPVARLVLPALLAAGLLVSAGEQEPSVPESIAAELEELAAKQRFAGSVLIARGEQVLFVGGYGLADRELEAPFSAETISSVGSITKQFTGAAILKLAEQEKLRTGDRLDAYFEDLPEDKAAITLHQLLTHTAGFVVALGSDEEFVDRDTYLEAAWDSELLFAPGARHEYSNVGYSILAAVVELRTAGSYEEYLREVFFEPLGMEDTGYVLPDWDLDRVAVGYRGEQRFGTVLEHQDPERGFSWHLIGNGGIHSTVGDLHRWFRALRSHEVLSEKSTALLFGEHVDEGGGDSFYGYGWVTFHQGGDRRMVGHNGGNGFFFADVNFFPDREDLLYILLVNDGQRSEHASGLIGRELVRVE